MKGIDELTKGFDYRSGDFDWKDMTAEEIALEAIPHYKYKYEI